MMRTKQLLNGALALCLLGISGRGAQTSTAPAAKPRLTLTLSAAKDQYTLDPAQIGKPFRDALDAIHKRGAPLPPPPNIALTLTLTNTSDQPVTLTIDGDASRTELKLDGPGAVTLQNNVAMTMEFRTGTPITIAPGKSETIKLSALSFGARGISEVAYWTEPGAYTLSATLIYREGEKEGQVTSEPIKLKIVKG